MCITNTRGWHSLSEVRSDHLPLLTTVNTQERKLQFYLLCYQGLYYFAGGIILLLYNTTRSPILQSYPSFYTNLLIYGFLMSIGLSLFLGRRAKGNTISLTSLGALSALVMLVYQISVAFSSSTDLWQSLDLIVQLLFLVIWGYLIYWKWIEGEFAEMKQKQRK